jgi:hypothetical protein
MNTIFNEEIEDTKKTLFKLHLAIIKQNLKDDSETNNESNKPWIANSIVKFIETYRQIAFDLYYEDLPIVPK